MLLIVYTLSVAFAYLPPDATIGWRRCKSQQNSQQNTDTVEYTVFEEEQEQFGGKMFCLETAIWLAEYSLLVYYDLPDHKTNHGFGPMDMELVQRTGFRVEKFVSDEGKFSTKFHRIF